MFALERLLIDVLLRFIPLDTLNAFFRDPQTTATLIGALIAVAGALLGTFLLLRGQSLVSDAISHTVLFGIVVAFMLLSALFGQAPDLSSPWLILGAAAAGVATVVLTELIQRSGLVRADAALGLAFPLLFALAVILVSRYVEDVHIDDDAVMVGEIGLAWANTNSHCISACTSVTITLDDPRATFTRQCTNCRDLNISPRDPAAQFTEVCANCGAYSPAQAYQAGLTDIAPQLVFWPRALSVTGLMALLTLVFVVLLYKELKLASFDAALARALGLRPGLLQYALMVLVSLVAVGAFDAVGSILVIAFFIIPPATAYLLTARLAPMLLISAVLGCAAAVWGYDLARGTLFGVLQVQDVLVLLNRWFGLGLQETWDSSISASMVLMMALFFGLAWLFSPRSGLIATLLRRADQRRRFETQVLLGHVYNHQGSANARSELALPTLHEHLRWTAPHTAQVVARLRAAQVLSIEQGLLALTPQGEALLMGFRQQLGKER